MILKKEIQLISLIIVSLVDSVQTLICFECDSYSEPECRVDFDGSKFKPKQCPGEDFKCGFQLHATDTSVGIIRTCYRIGSLSRIDETNGCKNWSNAQFGNTGYICFCDKDCCNSGLTFSDSNSLGWSNFDNCNTSSAYSVLKSYHSILYICVLMLILKQYKTYCV